MTLLHGTSVSAALKILAEGPNSHMPEQKFYCLNSDLPESLAGALCFATANSFRKGSLQKEKNLLTVYSDLNPDFPKGFKRLIYLMALKLAAFAWAQDQKRPVTNAFAYLPAIIEFEKIENAKPQSSYAGILKEVVIEPQDFAKMKVKAVYWDPKIHQALEWKQAIERHSGVAHLSIIDDCLQRVHVQAQELNQKRKLAL